MKKLIVAVLIIGCLVGAYVYVIKYVRAPLTVLEGKTVTTTRGDLEVDITASGHIRPRSMTQIKSEASGEVSEIPYEIGQMVTEGSLILRLDPTDEERNVARADADYQRFVIAWEEARLRRQEAEDVGIPLANAKLRQSKARRDLAAATLKEHQERRDAFTAFDLTQKELNLEEAEALVKASEAEVTRANLAVELAEAAEKAAEQSKNSAARTLDEAKERLAETEVDSPIDGMLVARNVQIGELVQSGKTSLTGGTVLMELADVGEIYAEVNVDEADIGLVRQIAPDEALPGAEADTQPAESTSTDPADQPTTRYAELPEGTIDEGQEVEITVEAYPEEIFKGVIEKISPQSEMQRAIATFRVWIRLTSDNRDRLKRVLNTQAQAKFMAKSVRNAVLVDYEAMKKDPNGEGYGVFIPVVPPGQTRPEPKFVPCQFGVDNRVQVEVIEGLEEGQDVYTQLPKKTRKEQEEEQEADS